VQSCVLIIQQGTYPKVLVMSHMTNDEHKAVNKYLKQNIQIGLEFVLQKNVLRLPDTEPPKRKKSEDGKEDIQPPH
jgi:hypothetical protein